MYELQDLKMNIKFEIEMLCQKFNVTLADVPMYGRLRTRMTPQKEKNQDFNLAARSGARATVEPARSEREDSASGMAAGAGSQDAGGDGTLGAGGVGGADGGAGRDGAGDGRGAGGGSMDRSRGGVGAGDRSAGGAIVPQGAAGQHVKPGGQSAPPPQEHQTVIPNLASYVTINPAMEAFAAQPQLKEVGLG